MSVGKYTNSIRMREAKRLLSIEKLSTKEVATMMNFSSLNYFCYSYQKFYGRPPRKDVKN